MIESEVGHFGFSSPGGRHTIRTFVITFSMAFGDVFAFISVTVSVPQR